VASFYDFPAPTIGRETWYRVPHGFARPLLPSKPWVLFLTTDSCQLLAAFHCQLATSFVILSEAIHPGVRDAWRSRRTPEGLIASTPLQGVLPNLLPNVIPTSEREEESAPLPSTHAELA